MAKKNVKTEGPAEIPPVGEEVVAVAAEIPPVANVGGGEAVKPVRVSLSEIETRLNAERAAAREAERNGAALDVLRLEQKLAELGQPRDEWKAAYQDRHMAKVEEKRKTVQRLEAAVNALRDAAREAWSGRFELRQIEKENAERELADARKRLEALS
jgi:hypothetical protein